MKKKGGGGGSGVGLVTRRRGESLVKALNMVMILVLPKPL